MQKITILIHCKDQKGIIAAVTTFIAKVEGNITYIDQHVDVEQNVFFMRLECEFTNYDSSITAIKEEFQQTIATDFNMSWDLYNQEQKPKMALFVSKYDHCLFDILGRYSADELNVEIPVIISNHNDLRSIAERFDIPF
ncbi:MAG: ACT domain-containing protein, partial [Flavobacterium sp.]